MCSMRPSAAHSAPSSSRSPPASAPAWWCTPPRSGRSACPRPGSSARFSRAGSAVSLVPMGFETVRVAAAQATPVVLDAQRSVDKAVRLLGEAAAQGARLCVLPEGFISLYPSNAWARAAAGFGGVDELWERMWESAVEVPGPLVDRLVEACTQHAVHCAIGVNEREAERPGSLYNTLLLLGPDGLLHRHRKLMPTHHERLFHGIGAGDDLAAVETPLGRVGGLICWENRMPLARFAVYRDGPQIWVAPTADDSDGWLATVRHIAIEPRAFQKLRELPVVGRAADWGLGPRAVSRKTKRAGARVAGLKVTESVCPYCAVGCGQLVYTRDGEIVSIEGNPRSPINQGTLCPKGQASRQLIQQPGRLTKVLYRRPYGTEWEELELETAMDMIAERVIAARENHWQEEDEHGWRVDRTLAFAHLGGATLDNEENYLIKKLFTAMGAVEIENQARI